MVTFRHLRQLGYCAGGIKRWCAEHGFDARRFRDGVPASELRATGSAFAIKAADHAEGKTE